MIQVVVLGNGNVGSHLCRVFEKSSQVLLLQNYNRSGLEIENCNVPIVSEVKDICHADIYIITFNDTALYNLTKFNKIKGLVVHTSGATSIEVLNNFENRGVFYPLQSFKKEISIDFTNLPIAVESNSALSEKLLLNLAKSISKNVYVVNSDQRNALHVAAVFANNFSNFMYTQALDICNQYQIDFSILKPLIIETISKMQYTLPNKIQTGPAIRNDNVTIQKHLNILPNKKQKELYLSLTKAIQNYYGKEL